MFIQWMPRPLFSEKCVRSILPYHFLTPPWRGFYKLIMRGPEGVKHKPADIHIGNATSSAAEPGWSFSKTHYAALCFCLALNQSTRFSNRPVLWLIVPLRSRVGISLCQRYFEFIILNNTVYKVYLIRHFTLHFLTTPVNTLELGNRIAYLDPGVMVHTCSSPVREILGSGAERLIAAKW